jgi:hypothetical protein
MGQQEPLIMQIYCRLEVAVNDPDVIAKLAGQQLREADIDWSRKEEDLEEAVHQLESDLQEALACVVEQNRKPDDRFRPGFTDFL